jgi:predicted PurR-regulated permease PerM
MDETRPRWPFQVKLIVSLLLLAFFIYLLSRFNQVIPPLILAVILAFILSPVVNFVQSKLKIKRVLSIGLTYIVLLAFSLLIPVVIIPILSPQIKGLNLDFLQISQEIQTFLGKQFLFNGNIIDVSVLANQLSTGLRGFVEPFVGQTFTFVVEVVSSIVWVIFIFIVSFYLIKDKAKLQNWIEHLIPSAYQNDFRTIREEINQIWSAFFRGQIVLGFVVACIFSAIGLLIGLPFALGMGILAGLLEFIPSIGHGIWLVTASVLALTFGSTWLPLPNWVFTLIIIGMHLVYQQFDLNYLMPRIIGRRVQLPPLVVILGIVAGAVLVGVLGILLAAPTIASARVIGRYIYANLLDMDPFPVTMTQPTQPPEPYWWKRTRKK